MYHMTSGAKLSDNIQKVMNAIEKKETENTEATDAAEPDGETDSEAKDTAEVTEAQTRNEDADEEKSFAASLSFKSVYLEKSALESFSSILSMSVLKPPEITAILLFLLQLLVKRLAHLNF